MALADLLRVLEDGTAAELATIGQSAAGDAVRIASEAEARRSESVARAGVAFAAERRAAGDAELAAANRAARAAVLAARAAMLDRIRAGVRDRLAEVVTGDAALGAALIGAALACIGDESGTLRCTPAIAGLARDAAPPAIRVEADPAVASGAIIELASGTRIEATLGALLDRVWPSLACEALQLERAR